MLFRSISSLKRKIACKQAGRISFVIDPEEKVLILSSVLLSDEHLIPYDLREFVLKKGKEDLFADDGQRLILRKKFPLGDRKTPFRHAYGEFSRRAKEILDELLWHNIGISRKIDG